GGGEGGVRRGAGGRGGAAIRVGETAPGADAAGMRRECGGDAARMRRGKRPRGGSRYSRRRVTAPAAPRSGGRNRVAGRTDDVNPRNASGIALDELDPAIRPQDDLFRHVNGTWIARTEIPADKSRYCSFYLLADRSEEH